MEFKESLTNFLGKSKYLSLTITNYDQLMMHPHFIRDIETTSIITIFKVGFTEMRRRIVNSSRALRMIDSIQRDIEQYIFTVNKSKCTLEDLDDKTCSKYSDPNYRLYVFFIYLYFVCFEDVYTSNVSRQQTLDIMFAYSANKKYTPMIDFIFCALVSERQLQDGTSQLKCSQYKELDDIIRSYGESRDKLLKQYEEGDIDKPYIDSYMDAYSLALAYQIDIELHYEFSILDFKNDIRIFDFKNNI
jgi:hypothetical protein